MTSKLKCPVCQDNMHQIDVFMSVCINDKCKLWGSSIPNLVLESLTQAKQDLEIATRAMKEIAYGTLAYPEVMARETLELIEHKE